MAKLLSGINKGIRYPRDHEFGMVDVDWNLPIMREIRSMGIDMEPMQDEKYGRIFINIIQNPKLQQYMQIDDATAEQLRYADSEYALLQQVTHAVVWAQSGMNMETKIVIADNKLLGAIETKDLLNESCYEKTALINKFRILLNNNVENITLPALKQLI